MKACGCPNWRHAQPNAFLPGERVGGSDRRFTADLADVLDVTSARTRSRSR